MLINLKGQNKEPVTLYVVSDVTVRNLTPKL